MFSNAEGTEERAIQPAERMLLLLRRCPEKEPTLRQVLQDAHTPGSPSYHQWIKPEQFGELYGPEDSEIAAVRGWLQEHGFSVAQARFISLVRLLPLQPEPSICPSVALLPMR